MSNTIGQKNVAYGVTGQVGFNLRLAERVSFWPKLSLALSQGRTTFSPPSNTPVGIELYAPFLFHLTQHFFVGFGPDVYLDLLDSTEGVSNRRLFYGAERTVGGWF